jgi:hypothetical protein
MTRTRARARADPEQLQLQLELEQPAHAHMHTHLQVQLAVDCVWRLKASARVCAIRSNREFAIGDAVQFASCRAPRSSARGSSEAESARGKVLQQFCVPLVAVSHRKDALDPDVAPRGDRFQQSEVFAIHLPTALSAGTGSVLRRGAAGQDRAGMRWNEVSIRSGRLGTR